MVKNKTYKSDAFTAIHETASDLYEAGMIDKQTMWHFDESCLTPIREFTPEEMQALRECEQANAKTLPNW
jgi:putative transcriptional regulator